MWALWLELSVGKGKVGKADTEVTADVGVAAENAVVVGKAPVADVVAPVGCCELRLRNSDC